MCTVDKELNLVRGSGRKSSEISALPVATTSCVWRCDWCSATGGLRSIFPCISANCCRWCVSSSCVGREDGNEAKEGSHMQFLPSALPAVCPAGRSRREPLLHCCGSFFIIIIFLPGRRRESRIVGRPVSAAGFEQLGWGGRRLSLLSLVQRCQLYSDCVNVFFQGGTA